MFFSILPLVLGLLGLSGATLWRLSSGSVGLAGISLAAYMLRQMGALAPGEGRSLNYGVLLGLIASLCLAVNMLGWPWTPAGGLYLLSVWSIVGIAGGNFVELLFQKIL